MAGKAHTPSRRALLGALPAMAAIGTVPALAELPAGRPAVAVLEVQSPDDEQPVVSDGEVAVTWLHNPDHGHAASLLPDAVRSVSWRDGAAYVWMSAEAAATRDIRSYARRERKVPNGCAHVVGYWSIKRNTAR